MTGVNRWTAAALAATFLLVALLIAGTTIVQADPAAEKKAVSGPPLSGPPDRSPTATADPTAENPGLRQSAKNLRDIMSAVHTYHEVAGHSPAARYGWGFDQKTREWFRQRPCLSWRVLLLPFLGEQELFAKFHVGKPWDSEHNRKLIDPQ